MIKLLTRYLSAPTLKAAQAVRAYERSHPMARCMLSTEQADTLATAIHHANKGER